ncbi:inner membrane protein translocase component YidC, short form OxaI-like [Bacillus sp. JCM 19046]|uniref:Membrane protein insertase YidC n=2 Tax=Shouchella xiaoxiensis TaxID=766895 RepID=A0ABS2T0G3_9BACI|nr:YidC/Oxa1 family membrane protein insertase [Shouchella xiaoxiensis]GAF13095.1 inner membrane protein translocase component YidC, short form OxaI-like [Bacillus sp. JCM 19045]GAF16277.1 inner membrane protein translocase component YidC, short form OxaI-like [Bacillus sp. JCM 19046]
MKKIGWLVLMTSMLLLLSGCFSVNEPITSESSGIWNSFFVYPLSQLIIMIATWISSYGFAIIVVTILFRLLLLPLMVKQTKGMKAMQQLQPEMQKLRETYSAKDQNTRMKLNEEMQKMFAQHKVNPFAGCLPIIIQMPVFLAIYHAIMRTENFQGETFGWFLLSDPDPYFILPILAFVLTFIQQRMMMVQNNPQMKILLYLMPIMILVIGVFLPAAVILYWVVGNIFMIAQTYFITGPNAGKRGLESTLPVTNGTQKGTQKKNTGTKKKKNKNKKRK